MLTHHNWWSTHYECYAALCQKWGCSAGTTSILTNREVRDPLRKKTALSGGKTEKNLSQFFLRLANTYKKYILQKNWVKTVIPALSSGRSNLQRPIWGCHRQLDDRDHLVGQLTTKVLTFPYQYLEDSANGRARIQYVLQGQKRGGRKGNCSP